MGRSVLASISFVLLCAACTAGQDALDTEDAAVDHGFVAARYEVSGTIAGDAGPVPNAEVKLRGALGELITRTDSAGAYSFEVSDGSYDLEATAQAQEAADIQFKGERKVQVAGVPLHLEPMHLTGAVRGFVHLSDGADETGIDIYVPGTSFAARSNGNGYYVMLYMQPGTYSVRAEKDTYLPLDLTTVTILSARLVSIAAFTLQRKTDTDHDGIFDDLDPDDDNDGSADGADEFPLDNREWADTDHDGFGDNGDTKITSGPTLFVEGDVSFTFTASLSGRSGFECSLDGAAFVPCDSPKSYSALNEGAHAFKVRFVTGGSTDPMPAGWNWTTMIPPDTAIEAPLATTRGTEVTVSFSSADPDLHHFQCQYTRWRQTDPGSASGMTVQPFICTSPMTFTEGPGIFYDFSVAAVDDNGFTDSTPATATWRYLRSWVKVATGSAGGCAISTQGRLYCWANTYGVPVSIGTRTDWEQVSIGADHYCALTIGGDLYCWGDNKKGELGLGIAPSSTPVPVPTLVGSGWLQVAAGGQMTCGLKSDHTLWCWGTNAQHQTGLPWSSPAVTAPALVSATTDWLAVEAQKQPDSASDYGHSCALKDNGTLWCWGQSWFGRTWNGDTFTDVTVPTEITAFSDFMAFAVGNEHTCGLRQNGELWCVGKNDYGQLGTGSLSGDATVAVQALGTWVGVRAGNANTCGLATSGGWDCWGNNDVGQAGSGSRLPFGSGPLGCGLNNDDCYASPVAVSEPAAGLDQDAFVVGQKTVCAIGGDTAWCWGSGASLGGAEHTNDCAANPSWNCSAAPVSIYSNE